MATIDGVPSGSRIRGAYDGWSWIYDLVAAPLEHGPRLMAWAELELQPGERVLDAGTGTGSMLWRLSESVGPAGRAVGIDASLGMLRRARRAVTARHAPAHLAAADVLRLPFRDGSFDVVYTAYVLDLLSEDGMAAALRELRRVLRPGGRIIAVNMSKQDEGRWTWLERFYRLLPPAGQAWILGACRPVFLAGVMRSAGFHCIRRRYVAGAIASELVTAVNLEDRDVTDQARSDDQGVGDSGHGAAEAAG